MEEQKDPLYVDVRPDEATKRALAALQKSANIPNPYSVDKMHCTLLHSKKACDKPFVNKKSTYQASFKSYDFFENDGKQCLVLKLDSPDLEARHKRLMKETGGSYDFPQYLPHITLSYDAGGVDLKTLPAPAISSIIFADEKCVALSPLD